jgi:hypothetical protein
VASQFFDSLQQIKGREKKSTKEKLNLWGKLEGRTIHKGLLNIRGYSKPIVTVSITLTKTIHWYMPNFL